MAHMLTVTLSYGLYSYLWIHTIFVIAVFILMDIVTEEELEVWRNLSELFIIW